jgi:hypothetical protein
MVLIIRFEGINNKESCCLVILEDVHRIFTAKGAVAYLNGLPLYFPGDTKKKTKEIFQAG